MARSRINNEANTGHQASVPHKSHHITPAFLGHRCPQDVRNSINFHRGTLSEEICQFLESNTPNLRVFVEFWSRPEHSNLASGRAVDTICGASWMLAMNYLFLDQLETARTFMLNGAFVHQCAHKPIEYIVALCEGGEAPICDQVVSAELPYYENAFALSHSRDRIENYLMSVLPLDFMQRMSFAAHAGHKSSASTWVHDYVSYIGNDWGSSSQHPKRVVKGIDESCIEITMLNAETQVEFHTSIGVSHTLKELFTKYSDEQGISLRSLRFVFEGKPLFLSACSNKTPAQLGIRNHDVINVSSTTSSSSQDNQTISTIIPKKRVSSKKATQKHSIKSKKVKSRNNATYDEPSPKVRHSQALSKLFEEAEPRFRAIRQRLNNLILERTFRKEKSPSRKTTHLIPQPVNNPNLAGIMGKAGKSSYVIQVGEVNNLYKSSKKIQDTVSKTQMVDLHGYTQLEALNKLNESLPQWEKYAMEGSYPFVAPVVIVCGGGNQILSETVSQWIKENNLSKAPKNMFAIAA